MRRAALEEVHELARCDERVVFVGSDLGVGTLAAMKEEFPDRFFMEGVSEAYLIGMAAGLALEGHIVYVNTIATFLTRRCFEQIAIDLCLHDVNVRLIGNGGGLVYAPLGPTHLATDDVAILRSLPHMTIVAPADADEMRRLMPQTLDHDGPIYIRLAKGGDPIVTRDDVPFRIGRALPMRDGGDAAIVTTGVMLGPALEAAETLAEDGIATGVLHVPTIKPLDVDAVVDAARGRSAVVVVEEHTIVGGLGSAVAEVLLEAGLQPMPAFRRLGIPDVFAQEYESQARLIEGFGMAAGDVAATVRELVGARRGTKVAG
jgi:transketolase